MLPKSVIAYLAAIAFIGAAALMATSASAAGRGAAGNVP
jgi:hypothetical protein